MKLLPQYLRAIVAMTILAGVSLNAMDSDSHPSEGKTTAAPIGSEHLIQPEELARSLQSPGEKPLIIQAGFHVLYAQAHIPGSEYIGPASTEEGIKKLRQRVEALPRKKFIVLYCGCCPWTHCPNVNPAYRELHAMGFENVKVLYLQNNFGTDWTRKGYPIAKGD